MASIKRAEKKFIEAQQKNDLEYTKRCESGGATVYTPDAAGLKIWNDEFADKARYMYDSKTPVADKDLYERITAFLNKFRGN